MVYIQTHLDIGVYIIYKYTYIYIYVCVCVYALTLSFIYIPGLAPQNANKGGAALSVYRGCASERRCLH